MLLFYDPKKRKTKLWVMALFILVPIILIYLLFQLSKGVVAERKAEVDAAGGRDIFEKSAQEKMMQ